jgi:hypothetical protein
VQQSDEDIADDENVRKFEKSFDFYKYFTTQNQ